MPKRLLRIGALVAALCCAAVSSARAQRASESPLAWPRRERDASAWAAHDAADDAARARMITRAEMEADLSQLRSAIEHAHGPRIFLTS